MTAAVFHTAGRPFSFLEILRPFLLLAVLAFLAGFGGYLILGPPNVMNLGAPPQAAAAVAAPATPASAPAATGDWNAPKQV
jgi:uncharacterized membrane protein YfcA